MVGRGLARLVNVLNYNHVLAKFLQKHTTGLVTVTLKQALKLLE
jgi:hypothetical protein